MFRRTLAALAACLLWAPAFGAERLGRFTLDVKIEGAGQLAKGSEHSRSSTEESLHAAFTLASPGIPEAENRLEEAGSNLAAMQRASQRLASQGQRPAAQGARAGRYLTYSGTAENICRPEYRARIRSQAEGALVDVYGITPFTHVVSADFKATPVQLTPLCSALVVVDTANNNIFVYPPGVTVRGKVLRTEGKRPTIDSPNTNLRLTQEAMDWVVRQLQSAARSGTQRTTLKIPGAAGETGETVIKVEMSWSFEGK